MKTTKLFSALTAALLLGCVLLLSSCQEDCLESLYFEGQYATYPVITDTTGGILVVEIPSEGTATTLGTSKWYSDSEVHANTVPPWNQTGTMYFEDGDGDRLVGSFVGTSWPLTENPFAGEGDYIIDSGTGKYEGATGEGSYNYIVSPQMVGDLKFYGILTLPKQND